MRFQGSRYVVYAAFLVALVLAVLASGCIDSGKPNPTAAPMGSGSPTVSEKVHGTLTLGNMVAEGSAEVLPDGDKLGIDAASSPVDGLLIDIPAGSYASACTFTVSSAPVISNTFGNGFAPVSPLIEIDNGGVQANHLMLVTIPIKASSDDFVMGFYYDRAKQTLEGVPTVSRDVNSITVATSHFSDLVAAAYTGAVSDKLNADSGFRPGVDDWEFINYYTIANDGGQCGGQSLAEMYYYSEVKPLYDEQLYGLYDDNGLGNTPAIQGDDTLAYRLCSLVQATNDANNAKYWQEYPDTFNKWTDQLTFYEVKGAMLLTGEPQGLNIYSADQQNAHEVVCYMIEGNKLYIADPNKPGETHSISFVNGQFQPYMSSEVANDPNKIAYTKICYSGKTAMVPYSRLIELWDELDKGTVGDGIFPTYQVTFTFEMPDGTAKSLTYDHVGKNDKVINVQALSDKFAVDVTDEHGASTLTPRVYLDGAVVSSTQSFAVRPAGTSIGVEVWGPDSKGRSSWIGFGWFNVRQGTVSPTPTATPTKKPTATPTLTPVRQNIAKDWLNSAYTPVNPLRTAYSYYSNGQPTRMMYLRLDSQDNSQDTYIVKYMNDGSVQAVFHANAYGELDWYKWYDAYGTVVKYATWDSAGWHYIVGSEDDLFVNDPTADEPYATRYWEEWYTDPTPLPGSDPYIHYPGEP